MDLAFWHRRRASPWSVEFDALAKAFGGAVLFGMPLLFTMEMWWIGEYQPRLHLLGFLLFAFIANTVLARMSGFRPDDGSWRRDMSEAVEAMGVGVVTSLVVLLMLARIEPGTSIAAILGMVAVQTVPLSLGATVANLVFDPDIGRAGTGDGDNGSSRGPLGELLNDLAGTAAGAAFIGFAIAPTEEVPMLASALGLGNLLGIVAFSLIGTYVIVFASGFDPTHRGRHAGGVFQRPFSETMLAYVVSIAVALGLLYGFGQLGADDPIRVVLVQALVLAVPASIGGAAGRVVV